VVLGDNVLQGDPLAVAAKQFELGPYDAGTLLYRVPDPERFGVAEFNEDGQIVAFEEKPAVPKSDRIPIGVYFLRPNAFDVIASLTPSDRGEFEITDVLNHFLASGRLFWHEYEGRWTDAGTVASLLHASTMASEAEAATRA
jgi:glucose-1-phosphate thymidylyltransferase